MNVLSLFAGIGGLELGLERAGMTTVGQVEINPWCRAILRNHWPEIPQHEDVVSAPAWWASEERPPVHVVCGGFPCQPFSLGGKQLGIDDPRWLWPAMANVIRAVRPLYVLVENVAALVRDSWAWGTVLADLHRLGFDAEWTTVRASDFGAPHSRERVYLVAYPEGVDGDARDRMGESGSWRAPIAARGLPGLAAPERRRRASEWLAAEPRVDRLADGIPGQVDRLFGLGNAVVPSISEHIGGLIMADEQERSSSGTEKS